MANYVIRKQTAEDEKAADDFAQAEFDEEERVRQADKLAIRLATFHPHDGLKMLREKHGLTQAELANSAGVTRRTYQFYESGQKPIPSSVLSRLAAIYDFDLHELFTDDAHSDNLRVKSETAKLAADVVMLLWKKFDKHPMQMDEMQRIAMEVARSYPLGTSIERVDIIDAVQLVTGEKYVKYDIPYQDA